MLQKKRMCRLANTMNFTILFPADLTDRFLFTVCHREDCCVKFLYFLLTRKMDMVIMKKPNQCLIHQMVLCHGMISIILNYRKPMVKLMADGFLQMPITHRVLPALI